MELTATIVAERWPLTGVSLQPLASSYPTRQVLRVQSDQGVFAAKIDRSPPAGDDDGGLAVLDYLAGKGFEHAPALLHTRGGDRSVLLGGATVCVLEYVPSPVSSGTPDGDEEAWRQLGAIAARLNALSDCPVPSGVQIASVVRDLTDWVAGQPFEGDFADLMARCQELQDEPCSGLLHGEINFANTGRRADGTIVLLDWDGTGRGPTILEVGYPLIVVFLSEADLVFRPANAAAFYQAYAAHAPPIDPRRLFSAALLQASFYVRFGDVQRRWQRIRHALAHEDEMLAAIGAESPIRLRAGVEDDAEGVSRVLFEAIRGTAAASYPPEVIEGWARPPDDARREEVRQAFAGGDELFVVAEEAGAIVGFGSIVPSLHELRAVYVDPRAGRRGIGGRILAELERLARGRGLPELHMDASLNAEAFYRRHGYQVVERGVHRQSSGVEMACVRMRKTLGSNQAGKPP